MVNVSEIRSGVLGGFGLFVVFVFFFKGCFFCATWFLNSGGVYRALVVIGTSDGIIVIFVYFFFLRKICFRDIL